MSEYQYYEFQAIDRTLTDEEQQAVAALSSRVEPHPRQAVFVYHWSDFRGDPEAILCKYYDAMLYMANWGSRQLMFRFPRGVLDLESANAYCRPLIVQDCVSFSAEGDHVILNIEFHDEEAAGWADGEGWLPAMLGLRDDIMHGDYRTLYLARREPEAWAEVESLIEQMQARPYDDAVALLIKLRDLARHQGEEAVFQVRINHLYQKYSRRSALIRRMRDAGLYKV